MPIPPAPAKKDGTKQEVEPASHPGEPNYTNDDTPIIIHYSGHNANGGTIDCVVTIKVNLEYTLESESEVKKNYVQYCVTYKIKITITFEDSCNPGKNKPFTIETEHKFCDGDTDTPHNGLAYPGTAVDPGPLTLGRTYPNGTKITAKQDKDKTKITITVTQPDPPGGGTETFTIPK